MYRNPTISAVPKAAICYSFERLIARHRYSVDLHDDNGQKAQFSLLHAYEAKDFLEPHSLVFDSNTGVFTIKLFAHNCFGPNASYFSPDVVSHYSSGQISPVNSDAVFNVGNLVCQIRRYAPDSIIQIGSGMCCLTAYHDPENPNFTNWALKCCFYMADDGQIRLLSIDHEMRTIDRNRAGFGLVLPNCILEAQVECMGGYRLISPGFVSCGSRFCLRCSFAVYEMETGLGDALTLDEFTTVFNELRDIEIYSDHSIGSESDIEGWELLDGDNDEH